MSDLRTVHDQMGREVTFSFPPKRIISLVPSQTEFLIDIGAPLVGRTKFCIHPEETVKEISIIGGTKKFRFDAIRALKPDLIVGNKEENYKEGIELLGKEYPVWMSDVFTLKDSFKMMSSLGSVCNRESASNKIVHHCKKAVDSVKGSRSGTVVYLIWRNPWMAAGKNTFIDHLLNHLGFENLIVEERYPELSSEQIRKLNPDHILFSSEPYPFKEKHIEEAIAMWSDSNLACVDGELYSWYGSRLKHWSN